MAASKRETILAAIKAALQGVDGIDGRVYRSRPDPNERAAAPYIALEWSSENATPLSVPQIERTLTVQVSVLVRGDEPDRLADPIAVSVHALMMADPTFGGLAIDTMLKAASFEAASADQTAGRLTHEYDVLYRHSYADMTA